MAGIKDALLARWDALDWPMRIWAGITLGIAIRWAFGEGPYAWMIALLFLIILVQAVELIFQIKVLGVMLPLARTGALVTQSLEDLRAHGGLHDMVIIRTNSKNHVVVEKW